MRKVVLFVNPTFEQRASQRAIVERIAGMLHASGVSLEIQETLSAQSAGDQARVAIADGCDAILVCGGDGTIFSIVQGVAGSEIPIGIIPFGTGNVLAQNIGLSRNPLEAARALLRSTPRKIPLGQITLPRPAHSLAPLAEKSWYFTMAAGMGLHAALMSAADGWGKRSIGRASYYFAGASLLLRHRIQPFEVEVTTADGRHFTQRVCEAIAVRVPELNRWRPGGRLEEPVLRLATVDATGRRGLAQASFEALARTSSRNGHPANGRPSAHYADAIQVICRPVPDYEYESALLVEADGEVLGASTALITIARESFWLLWPDDSI